MRGAPPLMLFRVMAGNARAWEKFRAGSLLDRGPLSLREREIVIDRTCARTGCEYEWGVHVATFAEAAHLTDEQVRATVRGAGHRRMLVGRGAGADRGGRRAARARNAQRRRIRGAVGALRRGEDFRDHPAVRLLSHRVVSRQRPGAAAGREGGAVSEVMEPSGRVSEANPPNLRRKMVRVHRCAMPRNDLRTTPRPRAADRADARCRPACSHRSRSAP